MIGRIRLAAALILVLECISRSPAGEPCHYTWIEIPNPPEFPGGTFGWVPAGRAINNQGRVTGVLQNIGDNQHGFIWSPEEGSRALPRPAGVYDLRPHDINDLGHVVGTMYEASGMRAFFWDGSEYSYIQYPTWANNCEPYSINNAGQIVGMVQHSVTGPTRAFTWEAGVFTDLSPQIGPVESFGTGVSERGQVIGWWWLQGVGPQTFVIDNGDVVTLPNPPGMVGTRPTGENNGNAIVARGRLAPPLIWDPRGVLWLNREPAIVEIPVGSGSIVLNGINDQLRSVGTLNWLPDGPARHDIVWQYGTMRPLSELTVPPIQLPPWSSGWGINQRGQILVGRHVLTPNWLPGDLTGDCHVTMSDLALVLIDFGSSLGSYAKGDVDFDGDVDLGDLAVLLTHWGE